MKHQGWDYWRYVAFNPTIGIGRHRQIVEASCQRSYEGKGVWPSYIARGVIEGFPEQAQNAIGGRVIKCSSPLNALKDTCDRSCC